MNRKWITIALLGTLAVSAYADEESRAVPGLPERRISLSILSSMPATNLLEFVASRSGLRLDLADEIKTNAVSFRFKFDEASSADVAGWALRFLNAHADVNGAILRIAPGSPPDLPEGRPLASSPLLSQPFGRTNSWTHRVDQTVEYVLHVAGHHNFVMGPDSPAFQTPVLLAPNARTAAEILEDACAQAGLECSLRGNIVFIRKKESLEKPNHTSEDIRRPADGPPKSSR